MKKFIIASCLWFVMGYMLTAAIQRFPAGCPFDAGGNNASIPGTLTSTGVATFTSGFYCNNSAYFHNNAFTITAASCQLRMLVYALGRTVEDGAPADGFDNMFDARVPPTQPGFVVPEPATIAAAAVSFVALSSYVILKRKANAKK